MAIEYTLNHFHVYCSNFDVSEKWFRDGVGATFVSRDESAGFKTAVYELVGAQLLLREQRPGEDLKPVDGRRFGMDHIGLGVKNIKGAVEEFRSRGVEIEVEPREFRPNFWIAFIKGPDDVRIELVEHTA
jgi:catechol 2,3-dioxygenase-like lactoylglutathione lyase family enzyme